MIKLLRIDDRLLHGQVAFLWKEYLKLQTILVCNDDAANDDFTKQVLEFSRPKDVALKITELSEAKSAIAELAEKGGSSIVIVGSLFDAERIVERTALEADINIGGLRERPQSIKVCEYVAFTNEDLRIVQKLIEQKKRIWIARAPKDEKIRLNENMPLLRFNKHSY